MNVNLYNFKEDDKKKISQKLKTSNSIGKQSDIKLNFLTGSTGGASS